MYLKQIYLSIYISISVLFIWCMWLHAHIPAHAPQLELNILICTVTATNYKEPDHCDYFDQHKNKVIMSCHILRESFVCKQKRQKKLLNIRLIFKKTANFLVNYCKLIEGWNARFPGYFNLSSLKRFNVHPC